jgi:phage baseplate assembly protein W
MSNFLGVGFRFPFSVGNNGGIQLSKYEQNIEESVRIVIGTALGERQMRPTWGCRIHDFVFAPNNTSTQTLVAYHVEDALIKHEYRIRDIEVAAMADPDQAERILVDVRYTIRATNSIQNLVFPFYLTGS